MATEGNSPGLLSKVAKFVLNPTVDWVDIEKAESERSGEHGKLALKQMIERKQYNDAVRKREFEKLRKLRRATAQVNSGATALPSSFQDSWGYSVFEERAQTLKKIDEIEAQMSKQWWKGNGGPKTAGLIGREQTPQPVQQDGIDSAFATTLPSDLYDSENQVPTQMGSAVSAGQSRFDAPTTTAPPLDTLTTVAGMLSISGTEGVQADEDLTDPTLEEAAIRFANSDDGGAEAVLLSALQTPGTPSRTSQTWVVALLDLYRATDQMASFEHMATDYAKRFGGKAPVWLPVVQGVEAGVATVAVSPPPGALARGPWQCPAVLEADAVQQLQTRVHVRTEPWHLDWRALKTLTPGGAQALSAALSRWCELPLLLQLDGMDVLDNILRLQTTVGDKHVAQYWWHLRLDAMRIQRSADEFDLVALDFCVTYEVSPPSWRPARCQRVDGLVSADSSAPAPLPPGTSAQSPLAMSGEVLGDAANVLQLLQAALSSGSPLVVSCANLVRVDFSAAGSILNWLANAQVSGASVELHDVPQLVAAFFSLIGINEHARVTVRTL
ncbi:MAG: STAS domain-containing protein [Comamonadaceae bacterium]|nr:STAS domain-containing protein [Comamonadaceae bacterium]